MGDYSRVSTQLGDEEEDYELPEDVQVCTSRLHRLLFPLFHGSSHSWLLSSMTARCSRCGPVRPHALGCPGAATGSARLH